MKSLRFVGSSLDDLRDFPAEARREVGFELDAIQRGHEPSDWKPMKDIGSGVREIRIHVLGEWRIIYVANLLMPSTYFTLFKRKLKKRGKKILNWHVTATAKLKVNHERTNYRI